MNFKNLEVEVKLLLGIIAVSVLTLTSMVFINIQERKLISNEEKRAHALEARVYILEARRHEKNLQLRHDQSYVKNVNDAIVQAKALAQECEVKAPELDDYLNKFNILAGRRAAVEDYERILVPIARDAMAKFDEKAAQVEKSILRIQKVTIISITVIAILLLTIFGVLILWANRSRIIIATTKQEQHALMMSMAMNLSEYMAMMEQFEAGDLNIKASENTGDELFDRLGKSTNRMIESFNKMSNVFAQAAKGNLDVKVDIRSEKDELGKSLQAMISNMQTSNNELHMNNMDIAMSLTEYFGVLNQISEGNLETKANEKSGNDLFDQLGKSTNGMIASLKHISDTVQKVAAGDLTENVNVRSDKDILSISVNQMVQSLKNLVMQVKDQANSLADSSSTLAQISEQSSQTISQLSMTASQISASTSSVAQSSQNASNASQTADGSSRKGRDLMMKLVEKIKLIKEVEDKSAVAMNGLSVSSAKIGEIVGVITKIADQTNLLSLNAAIEAARAGEAGHGFAVVADEVRKLAESSASSAQEIARIIRSVQEETKSATQSVQSGKKEIEEGAVLTEESNTKFTEIAAQIENIAHQIEQIAAAAEESAASAEEAAASSEEQAAAMEEIASTASNLSTSAKVLLGAIEKFKV